MGHIIDDFGKKITCKNNRMYVNYIGIKIKKTLKDRMCVLKYRKLKGFTKHALY